VIRVCRFLATALVAFAAILAVDHWLRLHGFVAGAVMSDWGEVVLYGDGKGSFREFTTRYPPIAFALNLIVGVPVRELCSLPPPIVTAALLAAMWASALRAGGYGQWGSVALTALVCLNPFFLYMATTGVSAMLLLIAVYWFATAYRSSRFNGRVTDFMNLAFALAFIAFVHPFGAFICVLALPFLVFALPPSLVARSAVNSMLVLLFPLLFALASFTYGSALFQDSTSAFLRSVIGHFAAAVGADQENGQPPVMVEMAAPTVALAVVAVRYWPADRRRRGVIAALLLVLAALGASTPLLWRTGEPAHWRQAAMGTPVIAEQNAGAASLGRFLAAHNDVLIDASAHPEILAARGSARGLVVPTDEAFMLTTVKHQVRSRVIAVPDPNGPAMHDGDLLNQMFPKLYEQGMRGYGLTYDAIGWRVYERNDARNSD
jgi:hypothetical protein